MCWSAGVRRQGLKEVASIVQGVFKTMSKATKRKHVTREVLDDFVTPKDDQIIVKVPP